MLAEFFFVGCLVLKMKSLQSFKLLGTAQHQVVSLSVPEDRGHGLPGCDDLYQHFGGICCLCLQETGITSRKTIVIICTVVRI
jgi:hypothetical protein